MDQGADQDKRYKKLSNKNGRRKDTARGCPRGVMNGKSDGLRNRSKRVRIPVALLGSLSGK